MSESKKPVMDAQEIIRILPHRYPFLLVDRILDIDLNKPSILGQKNVSINEPFFPGHFPDVPIMPGVLILEALAQTGGILIFKKGYTTQIALFLSIYHAKFRRPVRPGDILTLYAEGKVFNHKGGRILAKASVDTKLVTEAEISYVLVDKQKFRQDHE